MNAEDDVHDQAMIGFRYLLAIQPAIPPMSRVPDPTLTPPPIIHRLFIPSYLMFPSNAETRYGLASAAASSAILHVDDPAIGVEHAFVHHFRQRWMRENRVHQFFFGGFEAHGDDETLDEFGHLAPTIWAPM